MWLAYIVSPNNNYNIQHSNHHINTPKSKTKSPEQFKLQNFSGFFSYQTYEHFHRFIISIPSNPAFFVIREHILNRYANAMEKPCNKLYATAIFKLRNRKIPCSAQDSKAKLFTPYISRFVWFADLENSVLFEGPLFLLFLFRYISRCLLYFFSGRFPGYFSAASFNI